jgi:hypothetical protein
MSTPLRDQLVASKLATDPPTEYTRGYNAGIDTAVEIVDQAATDHAGATSAATTTKLGELRAAGIKTGGPSCPYGYELEPDGRTLRQHPAEQRTIELVRRLRAGDRLSWRAISATLAAQGMRARNGERFVPEQLRRMVIQKFAIAGATASPSVPDPRPIPMGAGLPVSRTQPVTRVSGKRRATKHTASRRKPRR